MENQGRPDAEFQSKGILLYKTANAEVFIPRAPKIPVAEGIHIEVSGQHDSTDTPKQVLGRFLLGLGAAKMIAESGQTPEEPWANTRIEAGQTVSVYGRNVLNPDSWRKPVVTHDREVLPQDSLDEPYNQEGLQKLSERYLSRWEKLGAIMNLFPDEIKAQDVLDENFKDYQVVWRSNTHTVTIQTEPHLKGYHLVVHPNINMARQWQTVQETKTDRENQVMVQRYIQSTLEATAIAMGIQQLLAKGAGEIHNSGNWTAGLKTVDEGGTLSLEGLEEHAKKEKRAHRPDLQTGKSDFGTSMHVHVYIPEDKTSPVVLPKMSEKEAREKEEKGIVAQWEEIPSMTQEQITEIREKIGNGKLTDWLKTHATGFLGDKNPQ